jgi:hypothetical protein
MGNYVIEHTVNAALHDLNHIEQMLRACNPTLPTQQRCHLAAAVNVLFDEAKSGI